MQHLSKISAFLAVSEHQSFSVAARGLGMTGPAISKQVQALEDQIGVRLLHRTTRQVTLTEAGALYYEQARRALDDLQEAERSVQNLENVVTGTLRMNVPMSFGTRYLAKPLSEFAKSCPDLNLEVDFEDRHVDVIGEGYDIVVRIGALEDSSLIARKLTTCPLLLCASPEFLKRHDTLPSPDDLKSLPSILYTKNGTISEWRYRRTKTGALGSVSMQNTLACNTGEMMTEACLQGIGLAVLPIFVAAEYIKNGKLIHVLPDYETDPARNIYAVFPQNRRLSLKTRLMIDHLTKTAKTLPW